MTAHHWEAHPDLFPYVAVVLILVMLALLFAVFDTKAHERMRWLWRALSVATFTGACLVGFTLLVSMLRVLFA